MSTIVWRFSDGKPGHDVQTLGLAQALRAQADVEIFTLPVDSGLPDAFALRLRRPTAPS